MGCRCRPCLATVVPTGHSLQPVPAPPPPQSLQHTSAQPHSLPRLQGLAQSICQNPQAAAEAIALATASGNSAVAAAAASAVSQAWSNCCQAAGQAVAGRHTSWAASFGGGGWWERQQARQREQPLGLVPPTRRPNSRPSPPAPPLSRSRLLLGLCRQRLRVRLCLCPGLCQDPSGDEFFIGPPGDCLILSCSTACARGQPLQRGLQLPAMLANGLSGSPEAGLAAAECDLLGTRRQPAVGLLAAAKAPPSLPPLHPPLPVAVTAPHPHPTRSLPQVPIWRS